MVGAISDEVILELVEEVRGWEYKHGEPDLGW